MAADGVLVIDAGTSAMRALAVRSDGAVTPLATEPWPMFVPDDTGPFGREFDATAVVQAVQRLVTAAEPLRNELAAVAVTGQREGIVFLDARGSAVLVSPNIDARASIEGMGIDAVHGEEVYATAGNLPSLMQVPAKLQWMREHRPAAAARIARVLPLADWLAALLTGEVRMSRSLASEIGVLGVVSGEPATALLDSLGFAGDLLPSIVADGAASGQVMRGALAGLPVVLAGGDTQCALVGMGVIAPGAAGLVAGWSAPLQLVTPAPIFDEERRTWTGVHVAPGRWILESNAGEMGRALDWTRSMLNLDVDEAMRLAGDAPAGARDVLSVLGPRAMRASAMNAGIGAVTLPLPLVMSAPQPGDVVRSVLESSAYAVRANLEQLERIGGARIDALAMGGGMSRSTLFAQIVADVIDRPVDVARAPETSAAGAAVLGCIAAGRYASLAEAAAAMTGGGCRYTPDARSSAAYEDCYARWWEMSETFDRMGGA